MKTVQQTNLRCTIVVLAFLAVTGNAQQLGCTKNADGACYTLIPTPKTFSDAIEYCEQQNNGQLAYMSSSNADVINQLVREHFDKTNETCYKRITMLANHDGLRPTRYGTYAFTSGSGKCATVDDTDHYDVCRKEYDCSLVDWNVPHAFVCAKNESNSNRPWCMEKLNGIGSENYDYYVTCQSITGTVSAFRFPPMCLPFEYGDQVQKYAKLLQAQKRLTNVSIMANFIVPKDGAFNFCYPDVECNAIAYKLNTYGLCRREKNLPKGESKLVQLWPSGVVPYYLSGWNNASTNVSYIKAAMQLIENSSSACIRFQELMPANVNTIHNRDVVEIVQNTSPNTCAIEAVGRKSGVQSIAYGGECFNKLGTILRPLLHALGVPAEHTRSDRDEFITLHAGNVIQEPAFQLQAEKQSIPGKLSLSTPYDYDSVAHFPTFALAKHKNVTVFESKKNNNKSVKIGQRQHLSEGDKLKLRILYGECKA